MSREVIYFTPDISFFSFSRQGTLPLIGLFTDTVFDPAYSVCVFYF